MNMRVGVLDHYNVSTRKLGDTVRFYEEVLGFKNGPRPAFNFPGAWLYSEGHPVLHLNDISPTDKAQPPDSGVIDHVAFGSRGFDAVKQHLSQKGVPFRVNQVPNSVRWQSSSMTRTMWSSSSTSTSRTKAPAAPARAKISSFLLLPPARQ